LLAAGMAATAVGAVALTPVAAPERAVTLASPAVALTSIGSDIKAFYNAVEPWAEYAAEVATYALGFVPGLWWVAPGIDLAYYTIEPLVQAGVYSFADLIDLDFAQIPIDINAGINESLDKFVQYGLAWIGSLVPIPPLPPLPPLPPFPGASVSSPAASSRTAATAASLPGAEAVTAPETAEIVGAPESADTGAATDPDAAPVLETVAPTEATETVAATVAVAVAVEASSPKRQSSRATRTGRTAAGVAAPAAAQSTPENAVAAEPDGSAAAASTGASGKAKAARASRGAVRAG
jgi:hypothetical protein